ncbi:hypothetical protein Bcep1808_6713 (plasmid) [Burkholderia vietnamiensis G4]|uniref:Uncharacterized protein n=1 Tax=Burkholderia vietnamiensis (strain G4 / LMG 22486) TaxID=269482 RepID=A4JTJ8_BURVG|nr:hypothetical protein Bcep1808_6713 [Burkholderia vietnamiensis G4]
MSPEPKRLPRFLSFSCSALVAFLQFVQRSREVSHFPMEYAKHLKNKTPVSGFALGEEHPVPVCRFIDQIANSANCVCVIAVVIGNVLQTLNQFNVNLLRLAGRTPDRNGLPRTHQALPDARIRPGQLQQLHQLRRCSLLLRIGRSRQGGQLRSSRWMKVVL